MGSPAALAKVSSRSADAVAAATRAKSADKGRKTDNAPLRRGRGASAICNPESRFFNPLRRLFRASGRPGRAGGAGSMLAAAGAALALASAPVALALDAAGEPYSGQAASDVRSEAFEMSVFMISLFSKRLLLCLR